MSGRQTYVSTSTILIILMYSFGSYNFLTEYLDNVIVIKLCRNKSMYCCKFAIIILILILRHCFLLLNLKGLTQAR